jgi:hypothetical protein
MCSTTCHLLHVRAHTHCSCTRLVLQHNLPPVACPCPHALLMHSLGFAAQLATYCMSVPTRTAHALAWFCRCARPQAWTCLMSCTATVTLALSIVSGLRAGMPPQSKVSWLMSFAQPPCGGIPACIPAHSASRKRRHPAPAAPGHAKQGAGN